MAGVEPRFGEQVGRILTQNGWSQRELARRAQENGQQLSLATIQAMSRGEVAGPEKILAFALAAGEDPNILLAAAGWPFRYDPDVFKELEYPGRSVRVRRRSSPYATVGRKLARRGR